MKYIYDGEVTNNFGQVIYNRIYLETIAVSKAKAISNFKYQIKNLLNLLKTANIFINDNKVRGDCNE